MDTISAFGFEACYTAIVSDMAKALSERHGEMAEQQFIRAQAAVHMIMGLLPRDVPEALLASHCAMFHELMVDSAHDTLCAEEGKVRRAELHGLIALNKAFCGNLGHLKHYQKRPADGRHAASEAARAAPADAEPRPRPATDTAMLEPAIAARTAQAPASSEPPAATAAPAPMVSALNKVSAVHRPTEQAIASCNANPAAQAALSSGDAAGFARAMGIEQPSAAFLAAAKAPGSPFDPQSSGPWPETAMPDKPKT